MRAPHKALLFENPIIIETYVMEELYSAKDLIRVTMLALRVFPMFQKPSTRNLLHFNEQEHLDLNVF